MDLETFEEARPDLESLEGSHRLGRRSFLIGALATGAAVAAPVNYAAIARKRRIPFAKHGKLRSRRRRRVSRARRASSSGPGSASSSAPRSSNLIVATDSKFRNVVEEKLVTARKERDFTARTHQGPEARQASTSTASSPRTPSRRSAASRPRRRSTPRKPIRIGFYSCQHYESGFYNAQRAIANEPDLDLVLCLGDYIYEYSDGKGVRRDTTGNNHDGDSSCSTSTGRSTASTSATRT